MSKKIAVILSITLGVLVIVIFLMYQYFPKVWGDIVYPMEYDSYIVKYSKEYNLDPSLVSAVIYAESRFNSDSISRAGARGLMQIMPATGRTISERIGDSNFSVDKLLDPETNIRYGCWYLNYLFGNYPDNQNAVLAGYNGGGAVGDRYLVSRDAGIPAETSGYIRTVNSAQETYRQLYGDKLNTSVTAENIAERMKLQKEQEETFYDKIINNIRSILSPKK